jgi:ketol-acid reductoisomerase
MLTTFRDDQISPDPIKTARIAIIGYGRQGKAQALNLRDSGLSVLVGLRQDSPSRAPAEKDGFTVLTLKEAAESADFLSLLLPDQVITQVFGKELAPYINNIHTILFAGGYSVRFGGFPSPKGVDIILVAPMGPGYQVREFYQAGGGVPAKVAVQQDASGQALAKALAYAQAIGCSRAGCLLTTFAQEVELDLFSEQVVLCGGMPSLAIAAYETLVQAGYPAELAYIETVREVALIADLMFEHGIAGMRRRVSELALYGGASQGNRLITSQMRETMQRILSEIKDGSFAKKFQEQYSGKREELEKDLPAGMEEAGKVVEGLYWKG